MGVPHEATDVNSNSVVQGKPVFPFRRKSGIPVHSRAPLGLHEWTHAREHANPAPSRYNGLTQGGLGTRGAAPSNERYNYTTALLSAIVAYSYTIVAYSYTIVAYSYTIVAYSYTIVAYSYTIVAYSYTIVAYSYTIVAYSYTLSITNLLFRTLHVLCHVSQTECRSRHREETTFSMRRLFHH
ncbi:hypothetical protein J6590_036057 [Homalodisca vitripennis]|nr:hypothetical protein J6590_036057 [Homalodisca vitripennis]